MKKYCFLLFLVLLPIVNCQSGNENTINNSCITGFDINRYLGTWFELARYPHRFEEGLQGVKARYSLLPDGTIRVLNTGYRDSLNGIMSKAEGKAKLASSEDIGHLKVSFFLWFYADYRILELDTTNYQYALVGSSSEKYLWVLARSPYLADSSYQMLVEKAAQRGYDTTLLQRVQHPKVLQFDLNRAI